MTSSGPRRARPCASCAVSSAVHARKRSAAQRTALEAHPRCNTPAQRGARASVMACMRCALQLPVRSVQRCKCRKSPTAKNDLRVCEVGNIWVLRVVSHLQAKRSKQVMPAGVLYSYT